MIVKNGQKIDVGGSRKAFSQLANAGDSLSLTNGDLTVTVNKTSNTAANMVISFPTARNFQYGFINFFDSAASQFDNDRILNGASATVRTNYGYTRGNTGMGTVTDFTNGVIYRVTYGVGNSGTNGQVNWASLMIE